MKKRTLLALVLVAVLSAPFVQPTPVFASDDEQPGFFARFFGSDDDDEESEEEERREHEEHEEEEEGRSVGMLPVKTGVYSDECGSCHFAFQADLLPERSWKTLLGDLHNHFGDEAAVDEAHLKEITEYLLTNAGDHSQSPRVGRMMSSIGDATPIKITDIPYFKKEHRKIKASTVERASIHSLSNCSACHTTAPEGKFGEHGIKIPQ